MARGGYGTGTGLPLGQRRRGPEESTPQATAQATAEASASASEPIGASAVAPASVEAEPGGRGASSPQEQASTGAQESAPVPGAQPPSGVQPGRHCWISLPVDGSTPSPGLLVEWRHTERGRWLGRVVYVAQLRTQRWAVVDEWVAAEFLVPLS